MSDTPFVLLAVQSVLGLYGTLYLTTAICTPAGSSTRWQLITYNVVLGMCQTPHLSRGGFGLGQF